MSRKKQVERVPARRLYKLVREAGGTVTPAMRRRIKDELRAVMMVGACEERKRTLDYLKGLLASEDATRLAMPEDVISFIVSRSVLEVLGYCGLGGGRAGSPPSAFYLI